MQKLKLSVVGLGKLGCPLLAAFAAKGFSVIGLDINSKYVEAINKGIAPVFEPELQDYLDKGRGNYRATQDYSELMRESDVTFYIVPTPSKPDNHFSDDYLKDSLEKSAKELKNMEKPYHIFVITSTVSPGTINKNLIPLIEQVSGRKLNQGFGVAYNPEFIALGEIMRGFLNPDLLLIGESDRKVGDALEEIYKQTLDNKPNFARMSLVSAEITKISLNSYITMKISFANTLSNICERIPGANVDDITSAIGADRRVSPYYLKAGPPFSGPCFPRDARAFFAFAKEIGVNAELASATDKINDLQITNMVQKALENTGNNKTVAILGLAFKPNTPVIEESPAIKIIEKLIQNGVKVVAYDSLATNNAKSVFGDKITYASSIKEALEMASCVIVTTRDQEFMKLAEEDIVNNPTVVIDCWRVLDGLKNSKKVKYIGLGQYSQ